MAADVFFIAGEASGDLEAALLASALRERNPAFRFAAVGGRRLRAAGAEIVFDSSDWASIGPVSALANIPRLYAIAARLIAALRRDPPRLIVPIDFGAFSLRLLEMLRRRRYNGDVVYYFPPGAWLDNARQAKAVASLATPLTAFLHQRDFYRSLSLPIEYFGHPLGSVVPPRADKPAGFPPRIAILPGSRREEVQRHLPILADAARQMRAELDARFSIVAASPGLARQIQALMPRTVGKFEFELTTSDVGEAVETSDLAWVASGTAVLETALRRVPQITFYRVSQMQYRMALRRMPHIARGPVTLPNLVLGRHVVPELLQDDFTPKNLIERSVELLTSAGERDRQLENYTQLRAALGPPDALQKIAAFVAGRVVHQDA